MKSRCWPNTATPRPRAIVESAKGHIRLLNDCGFDDICVSLKSSSVPLTVAAYRLAAEELPYPLHLGVHRDRHGLQRRRALRP